jgi:hypothetical protein
MHDESLRESVDLRESCGKAKLILERIVPTISLLFPGYTCLVIDRGFIAFGATECYLRLNDRLGFDRFSSLGGLGGIGCLGGLRFVVFSTSDSHRLTWLNIASWYDVKLFVVIWRVRLRPPRYHQDHGCVRRWPLQHFCRILHSQIHRCRIRRRLGCCQLQYVCQYVVITNEHSRTVR